MASIFETTAAIGTDTLVEIVDKTGADSVKWLAIIACALDALKSVWPDSMW